MLQERSIVRSERLAAYWELTKPRISTMVLVAIMVSAFVAEQGRPEIAGRAFIGDRSPVWPLINVAIGMFLVAASGNAFNMYLERYTDFLMPRTAKRPLPDQRLSPVAVATFGAVCLGAGLAYLLMTLNMATFVCAAITWLLYVWVYTPMKTMTWLNTEVGAIAGALPILTGGLAMTESISLPIWSFFAVLVCWQFPHFMAIAWLYREQYRMGGMQMLTVVDPTGLRAGRKSIVMAIATGIASLWPLAVIPNVAAAVVFAILLVVLAGWYLSASLRFHRQRDDLAARKLLRVSVIYLPLYMLVLAVFSRFAMVFE